MLSSIAEKLIDPRFMGIMLVGIASAATAFALLQPILEPDRLGQRMKQVGEEREEMRRRERERIRVKVHKETAEARAAQAECRALLAQAQNLIGKKSGE